jgi:hypothetical protein
VEQDAAANRFVVKDLIDEIIGEEFSSPDLELHWLDEDDGDPETVLEGRVKLGAVTLNEMREHLGLDPFANAAADRPMVLTATGYVPIEANAGGSGSAQTKPIVQKYSPDQPRVPPGNLDGGQWTSENGSGASDSTAGSSDVADGTAEPVQYAALDTGTRTDPTESVPDPQAHDDSAESRVAQASNWRSQPVNLVEDEEPNGPGHAIAKHVDKTEAELTEQMQQESYYGPFEDWIRYREGSFYSIESANDLVNRTLQANSGKVDLVASGKLTSDYIDHDLGFITGYEMYRPDPYATPEPRATYGVGVVILYDAASPRGFRVLTAFPRNFD